MNDLNKLIQEHISNELTPVHNPDNGYNDVAEFWKQSGLNTDDLRWDNTHVWFLATGSHRVYLRLNEGELEGALTRDFKGYTGASYSTLQSVVGMLAWVLTNPVIERVQAHKVEQVALAAAGKAIERAIADGWQIVSTHAIANRNEPTVFVVHYTRTETRVIEEAPILDTPQSLVLENDTFDDYVDQLFAAGWVEFMDAGDHEIAVDVCQECGGQMHGRGVRNPATGAYRAFSVCDDCGDFFEF